MVGIAAIVLVAAAATAPATSDDAPCLERAAAADDAASIEPCLRPREEPLGHEALQRSVRRWLSLRGVAGFVAILDAPRAWDWRVRRIALEAAARVHAPEVTSRVSALAATSHSDAPAAMRALLVMDPEAAWSLGLRLVAAEPEVLGDGSRARGDSPARAFLRSLGEGPSPPAERERLLALVEEGFPSALATFDHCREDVASPSQCPPVFEALRSLAPHSLPALARLAASPDPLRRRNALFVLHLVGDPSGAPAFEAALRDPDPRVRRLAVWLTMGRTCDRVDAVAPLVADADPAVRRRAARALVECDRAAAVPVLLELLRHEVAWPADAPAPWTAAPDVGERPVELEPGAGDRSVLVLLEQWGARRTAWRRAAGAPAADRTWRAEPRDLDEWRAWSDARTHRDGDSARAHLETLEACAARERTPCPPIGRLADLQLLARAGDAEVLERLEALAALDRGGADTWATRLAIRRRLGLVDHAAYVVDPRRNPRDRARALEEVRKATPDRVPGLVSRLIALGDTGSLSIALDEVTTQQDELVAALFRWAERAADAVPAGGRASEARSAFFALADRLRPEDCPRAVELAARAPRELEREAARLRERCAATR